MYYFFKKYFLFLHIMAHKLHHYLTKIEWTGNLGSGTFDYRSYSRNHIISASTKPEILSSSDPSFRGDNTRYNPEELFLSSISSCHMLWYLHLCAVNHLVVEEYIDKAEGVMEEESNGSGHFTSVTLKPQVTFSGNPDLELAKKLHHEAHAKCFIANSVNFDVKIDLGS